MKKESYQKEVTRLQNELRLAKAELEYFNYLYDVVDLYEDAAHFIVQGRRIPSDMSEEEKTGCQKHLTRIKNLEKLVYA